MKRSIFIIALLFSGFVFQTANAQIRVSVSVNIDRQPVWGPAGYDHVDYYYMPDIDAYYYVPSRQYIYSEHGRWVFAASLPARFHSYDIYSGYKVVINEPKPYRHAATYRTKYASYKGRHDQGTIRSSHDSKYFINKDHPEHSKWKKDHNHHKN